MNLKELMENPWYQLYFWTMYGLINWAILLFVLWLIFGHLLP